MEQYLLNYLHKAITASTDVQGDMGFLSLAMDEIQQLAAADAITLYSRYRRKDTWKEITYQDQHSMLQSITHKYAEIDRIPRFELYHNDENEVTLLLPLIHKKAPDLLVSFTWKNSTPPAWLANKDLLLIFSEIIGNQIARGRILWEIARAKQDIQTILDRLPFAICLINQDWKIERVNRYFVELFGFTYEQSIGMRCYEAVYKVGEFCPWCRCEQAVRKGEEITVRIKDHRKLVITSLPLTSEDRNWKVLEIFNVKADREARGNPAESNFHFRVYKRLDRLVTLVSLLTEIMLLDPNNKLSTDNLKIVLNNTRHLAKMIEDALSHEKPMEIDRNHGKHNTLAGKGK